MIITIASCLITALVGGVVGLLFYKIEKKIDHMEKVSELRNREQLEMRTRERELLLANAELNLILAKKSRGVDVNGDLAEAEKTLKDKREKMDSYTHAVALERIAEE